MGVIQDIVTWSTARPVWQRDALRRLVKQNSLSDEDLRELTELAKAPHGLSSEANEASPISEDDVPATSNENGETRLLSIRHNRGVNALATGQTVKFGAGLTIVYGDNAAGKSGYTRILKKACRARGAESVLGNVLTPGVQPPPPSATINLAVRGGEEVFEWSDQENQHKDLSSISVFDRYCASVYLRDKTDAAFRPFGLDLFDKLSDACEAVRKNLQKEKADLEKQTSTLPRLPEGTAAQKAIAALTLLTKPEDIRNLGTLSDTEASRMSECSRILRDFDAADRKRLIRELLLRADRCDTLVAGVGSTYARLRSSELEEAFAAREALAEASKRVATAEQDAFSSAVLSGTGSERWRRMWDAAAAYSEADAYPGQPFPAVNEASCVLCQQSIGHDAGARLKAFANFLSSPWSKQVRAAEAQAVQRRIWLTQAIVLSGELRSALDDITIENEDLAAAVVAFVASSDERRRVALDALERGLPFQPASFTDLITPEVPLRALASQLRERAKLLREAADDSTRIEEIKKELRELEARQTLGEALHGVLAEIERKKKLAAFEVCLKDTTTNAITKRSTDVTKAVVTDKLARGLQDELRRVDFNHLEVEIVPVGGTRGSLYHKLVLKRATGTQVEQVVSEGEARCLAIAAFFSELSTAENSSGLIFDDPVSSLDHTWRERVATRLAEEAKVRQVIVFTHDVVFLLALERTAEAVGAALHRQWLRRDGNGPGVSSEGVPWVAMKVKDRIGYLKDTWQRADKLHRTGSDDPDAYDREAMFIYGRLREAWERALEEVLLGKLLERYRSSIQTQQIKFLADITEADCKTFESGMTKSSRWLAGHDKAPAENTPIPGPQEIRADIDALETWVQSITKRRK